MREIALAMSRTWPTVVDVDGAFFGAGGSASFVGAVSVVVVVGVAGGGGLGLGRGWIRLRAGGS